MPVRFAASNIWQDAALAWSWLCPEEALSWERIGQWAGTGSAATGPVEGKDRIGEGRIRACFRPTTA
jgi:hypothetical protein